MARRSEVELCFDSMSDLITNLAGGLILVVMLLLALTHEAPKPGEGPTGAAKGKEGEKSIRPLVERLNGLQIDLDRVNLEITREEALLKELDKQAEGLLKKSGDPDRDTLPPRKKK